MSALEWPQRRQDTRWTCLLERTWPPCRARPLTGHDGAGLTGCARPSPQPFRRLTVRILLPPPPAVDPPPTPRLALRWTSSPPAVLIWKCAHPDARLCLLATGALSRFLPIWLRFAARRRKRQRVGPEVGMGRTQNGEREDKGSPQPSLAKSGQG